MTDEGTLRTRYKGLRKKILSFTPFVRRRRHERIVARLWEHLRQEVDRERGEREALGELFLSRPPLATMASVEQLVPIASDLAAEVCLFVTHTTQPALKPHVVDHVVALLDAGVRVVLIVNTALAAASVSVPIELVARLHGCLVRENVGYDFGAWAHAYSMLEFPAAIRRLYLINDSIVGPIDPAAYRALLARVRASSADFVGMTNNPDPQDHLQSYYLIVNERLLRSEVFDRFMRGVVNMPSKQNVIDCYEIWLTAYLQRRGFSCVAMFPNLSVEPRLRRNDTVWSWKQLIALGFPFVKSGVLAYSEMADEARRVLPSRYTERSA